MADPTDLLKAWQHAIRDGEVAITIRQREYSDAEVRAELERGKCMWGLGAQARELGHELRPWLR
jgi:hypothetical protein